MKKFYIYFFLSLCPLTISAQDISQNFVMERIYLDSLCQGKVTTVSYYDGLGYGNETVSVSANGSSVYTVSEYDSKGRLSKSLLPFPYESSLSFIDKDKAISASEGFHNDATAYIQYSYDTSDNKISSSIAGKIYRTKGPTSIEEDDPEKKTKDTTNLIDYDKIINNSLNNKTDNLRVTRIW